MSKPIIMSTGYCAAFRNDTDSFLVFRTDRYWPQSFASLVELEHELRRTADSKGILLDGVRLGVGQPPRRDNTVTLYAKVLNPQSLEGIEGIASLFG
jgi:hypothetical protein